MRSSRWFRTLVVVSIAMLGVLWLWRHRVESSPSRNVSYSESVAAIDAGRVASAEIGDDRITLYLRAAPGQRAEVLVAERIPNVDGAVLVADMQAHGVDVTGRSDKGSWWAPWLWMILLFVLLPLLLWLPGIVGVSAKGARPMSFGRSKAKLYDRSADNNATFADVAGVDEAKAELMEVVRFLKEPARYRQVGAHVPKGVLLVGAPGTGKTLLARAVAGESGVPFFSMSGSEFVEMFVGVGASRVRDLFEQAKERAPCIIFIDELDAIGKTRSGAAGFVANEEREQTLNQLLVEMDGFDSGSGLVIMAATNRPEILDRALLRAGRFDRQVLVDRPDVRGREAILAVHARRVKLAPDVDLRVVAQRTPGMVGADLANVVNEAALASVRRERDVAAMADFEEAIDRIQLGLKKEGRVMTDDEKRRVSLHEAGHALVAASVQHADPVHRVTIIPRGVGALGATLQLPTQERYLMTRAELRDRVCVLLGGRAAEEIACREISTGAQNDLETATAIAREMVCRLGMSDRLGAITWGRPGAARFLGPLGETESRDFSEATARLIDAEVRAIVETEHARASRILEGRRAALDAIARELVEHETIDGARLAGVASAADERVAPPVQAAAS